MSAAGDSRKASPPLDTDPPYQTAAGLWLQVMERLARLEERNAAQVRRLDEFEEKLEGFKRHFETRSTQLEKWLRTTTITVALAAIGMAATIAAALLNR